LVQETEILLNECDNIDTLQTVKQHIKSAIAVLQATKGTNTGENVSSDKPHASLVAPNSKHQKQLTFYSTQRKRSHSCRRWAKPTSEEEMESLEKMKKMDITVCGVCWQEEETAVQSDDEIEWIECENCRLWVHLSCSGTISSDDIFFCKNCS
jgi:hypothetical protein